MLLITLPYFVLSVYIPYLFYAMATVFEIERTPLWDAWGPERECHANPGGDDAGKARIGRTLQCGGAINKEITNKYVPLGSWYSKGGNKYIRQGRRHTKLHGHETIT